MSNAKSSCAARARAVLAATAAASVACCLSVSAGNSPNGAPDVLTTFDGKKVETAAEWEQVRRPELLDCFLKNEYGVRPPEAENPRGVKFERVCPDKTMMDGKATRIMIRISYAGKYGASNFVATAFVPRLGKPAPAFLLICNRNPEGRLDPERKTKSDFWPAERMVERGYAAVAFFNGDIAPDWETGSTRGVFSCYEKEGQYRPLNRWATLSAWAWGASRVMDWMETEPSIDAGHVGVVGHSRGGKTALLAGATDRRFALTCSNDSGCSGAKLNHMDLPSSEQIQFMVKRLAYWFCGNYIDCAIDQASMKFDQHEFVALMAPRLVYIASASEDSWAGPTAEFQSGRLASPVWALYGLKGLDANFFPAVEDPIHDGCIGYHLRRGKHDLTLYDWERYMDFADRHGFRGR